MKASTDSPILIVDDEESVLQMICYLLRSQGFQVHGTKNGMEALEELQRRPFSVIVSDQKMPDMTGIELFKRTKEFYPHTVRILISGYADLLMAKEAIAQGEVYRFITKPFDMEEFLFCIHQALDHHRLLAENQRLVDELRSWNERLEREVHSRTQDLRESEEKYRSLFEKATEGIVLLDHRQGYTILDCNRAFERMTGYDRNELIGKDLWEFQDKRRYARGKGAFLQKLQGVLSDSIHLHVIGKERNSITLQMFGSEIEYGQTCLLQGFCIDITEQIKLKEDLFKAQQLIEEKSKDMEEFVYITSHEIQTPLVPILGYAKLLLEYYGDRLDGRAIGWLEEMKKNSLIVKRLVNELLDLSRIKTHLNPFVMIHTDGIVRDILKSQEGFLVEKGIVATIEGKLPQIYGDPTRVRMVFNNLIGNAIKYMGGTSNPSIRIAYRENDAFHEFSISDTGPGIPTKDTRNVFKPMWRHPDRKAEGTGLGLYFVKKIMEAHGGDVWVESEPGKGSTFYLSFPKIVVNDREG